MTCAVVSTPVSMQPFITGMLPDILGVIPGTEHVYVVCRAPFCSDDVTFTDPFDGALLVECRYFNDEPTARAWVADDIARRRTEAVR